MRVWHRGFYWMRVSQHPGNLCWRIFALTRRPKVRGRFHSPLEFPTSETKRETGRPVQLSSDDSSPGGLEEIDSLQPPNRSESLTQCLPHCVSRRCFYRGRSS